MRTRGLFIAACFVFISLGVVAAWFVSADSTSSIAGIEPYVRFMLSPWMLVTHALALGFIAFGIWFLGAPSLHPEAVNDFDVTLRQCGRLLFLVLALFSSALMIVGYLFANDMRSTFRGQQLAEERGIARLKAQQIDKWILDRAFDAQLLVQALRSLPLGRLAEDRESRQILRVLFSESLASNADRIGVALYAPDGTALTVVGEEMAPESHKTLAERSKEERGLKIVDVHLRRNAASGLAMDFILPVISSETQAAIVAVLVLTTDPARDLFKQIVQWPVPSPGSEVVIVRRDGDNLQLVSEAPLLGRVPPPLSFHLPLAQDQLPGVQALRRGDGAREGLDYRGKSVFSASAHVTGVPWQVVAKTDADEAMAPWRQKTGIVAAVIAATILSAAVMVTILWRGQRSTYRAFRIAQAEERTAMSMHFESLVRLARDPVFLIDHDGRIVDCNQAATAAYGYSADEFRLLTIADIRPPETREQAGRQFQAALAPGGVLFETIHRRKDGTTFPVEISSRAVDVDGRPFRQSFVRDISRRKEMEGELQRIDRVEKAVRAASSVLLRAPSEARLLEGMCDVIVHMGGYRLAFIGVPRQDAARTIDLVAIVGADAERIKMHGLTWGDGPLGQSITGRALRTGEIQVQQDFAKSGIAGNEGAVSLAEETGSGISLPLRIAGDVAATLTIHATQTNTFNDAEVDLLTELVDDLAYGIGALRMRGGIDPAQGPAATTA